MRKVAVAIGVLAVGALGIWIGLRWQAESEPSRPRVSQLDAEQAFTGGDFPAALAMAEQVLEQHPQSPRMRMIAAESATRCNELERALAHYAQIPERAPEAAVARWASGEIYYQLGKPREALRALDESLRLDPELVAAHERKAALLNTLGRRREALPHLMKLLQTDNATVDYLLQVGNLSKSIFSPRELERIQQLNPDDLSINLPLAIQAREQGQFGKAGELLGALLEQQPELIEARLQQGWLLLSTDRRGMVEWAERLPRESFENPDAWYLLGQAAQLRGETKPAIRCALEAIVRDADHVQAHLAAAQLIEREGDETRARAFAQRAGELQRLNLALEQIYTSRRFLPPIEEAAQLAHRLGRLWEAIGWSAYALSLDSTLPWPRTLLEQVRLRIRRDSPRTLPEFNLAAQATWRLDYPLPAQSHAGVERRTASAEAPTADAQELRVAFEDVAQAAGIDFVLAQPPRASGEGKRMFESTGAGAGAIDFDGDGWCDVFLVQAKTEPPGVTTPAADRVGDQLLRNFGPSEASGMLRFEEVSAAARIEESDYGQGLAVADVDSDGFDDVYVCNFGRNQLWLNQGDGTFADGNGLFPSQVQPQWTVSAVIADINLDGRPEIYDANYVTGENVLTKLCDVSGKPRVCPPLVFTPAPHSLWMSDREGRFDAFTGEGADALQGYGLGVVAFKASDSSGPQIFVAIDQQANLLLTTDNGSKADGNSSGLRGEQGGTDHTARLQLRDEAIVRGAAFDAAGRSQACMGIATGDVNGDGQVDFFVTNFYNESNTLYLQDNGFYRDASAEYNLVAPSLPMLGFGTQFLDIELDGRSDVVVLNGHIDDLSHIGAPYQMRPQAFRQTKAGKFEELSADSVGAFFTRPALGRALMKADFNRDGLEDLVATDLKLPLALLQNRSQAAGQSVVISLVGTKSDRNAFFTQATLRCADFQQKQQLVAGGGYMASNERSLHFSVPKEASAMSLDLQWPSGTSETCHGLQGGHRYVIVEGRGIVQSSPAESK